ncbi:MAG: hypothetical protein HYY25_07570 [Candidatus Wallbacteria bacterium]|nr:hypothetical protein [Candidatus Wallbacteria bacterium]MBI4866270.1 hypothetical protein [Candidatus Wallbacteria bacterium]
MNRFAVRNVRAVLAVLAVVGTVLAAEPVQLQYKFEKDAPLRYKLLMKSRATFSMPDGAVENQNMTSSMELEQELLEKQADGNFKVAVTILNASQSVNGQARQIPVAQGHSQVITMKPNGEVLGDNKAAQSTASSQLQMVFPAKAVSEGETWEQKTHISEPIPLETSTRYTLDKVETTYPGYGKTALIKSSMGIQNDKTATGDQVNSTTKGNLWFDAAKGCIVRSKAASSFKFDLPVNIPGVINSTVKVSLDLDIEIALASIFSGQPEEGGKQK